MTWVLILIVSSKTSESMITFMESIEAVEETDNCVDSQLWHACAGSNSMVQIPSTNSKVFYFPQGHSEHAAGNVDFWNCPRVPSCIPCLVSAVNFRANIQMDEVFVKLQLVPYAWDGLNYDDGGDLGSHASENQEKLASFAKTLTQSDANNGGGFSVPRYCAEKIFPPLDFNVHPPLQVIVAKDVHGQAWKFRHIYRGTPRRHLLTTGWSSFVNNKKLVAGDSVVFMRAENGDLCVGIRRARKGIANGPEMSGWISGNSLEAYGGFSSFLREDESRLQRNTHGIVGNGSQGGGGRLKAEDVIEAATLAASGQPFEVIYYPRARTPAFCVGASLVKKAMQVHWCSGMRFKMAVEAEDSSRLSWYMGTVTSVQPADPIRWPDSLWKLLMVSWDEPEQLPNVRRVNPWEVQFVSNLPAIHLSPFSPRKRMRFLQHPEYPTDSQLPMPTLLLGNHILGSSNPFGRLPNNTPPAGMQGARHAQFGPSLSNPQVSHFPTSSFAIDFLPPGRASLQQRQSSVAATSPAIPHPESTGKVSCLLTMGNPSQGSKESDNLEPATFFLFGQPIYTGKQNTQSSSSDTAIDSDEDRVGNTLEGFRSDLSLDTGHCKVFVEFEHVGRTLDLSVLRSYEELYGKLGNMFSIGTSEIANRISYRDANGAARQIGDEPYSNFTKLARRLTIQADSSCSDNVGI